MNALDNMIHPLLQNVGLTHWATINKFFRGFKYSLQTFPFWVRDLDTWDNLAPLSIWWAGTE